MIVAVTLVSSGCVSTDPVPTSSSTVAPSPSASASPLVATYDFVDVKESAFEAGVLVSLPVPETELAPGIGSFFSLIPTGQLWWTPGEYGEDLAFTPFPVWEVDPLTGKATPWELIQYVGKAAQPDGSGFIGEMAVTEDTVVWIARHEGRELTYDDYDVFASDRDGTNIRKIGESTVDWNGLSFSAYLDGNYPMIAGGRAYWVDGTNLGSSDGDASEVVQAMSIFSAPLDGTEGMREELPGAWMPQLDRCASVDTPTFTYLVSSASTHDSSLPDELHRRILNPDGTTASDTVLWTDTDPLTRPNGAVACGTHYAVGLKTEQEDGSTLGRVEVFGPGSQVTLRWGTAENSGFAGRLTMVEEGLFFFQWNGNDEGRQFYFDFGTRRPYLVGNGSSFGFGVREPEHIVVTAWTRPDSQDEMGRSIYDLVLIGFP